VGVPSLPPGGAATPAVGDLVWVTFEGGDTDYPIWDAGAAPDPDAVPADGHVGRYRALVADNVDPMEEHRLNVKIPEVLGDDTTAWAKAAPDLAAAESAVPDIGTEVWIEFESGDPNYPIWVGVAWLTSSPRSTMTGTPASARSPSTLATRSCRPGRCTTARKRCGPTTGNNGSPSPTSTTRTCASTCPTTTPSSPSST